ncbi:MAG: hypothetical protein ACPIOQ_14445, partial [Promethearchaeia archaeon]
MKQRLTFLSIAQRPTLMSAPFGAIPRCQDTGLGFYPAGDSRQNATQSKSRRPSVERRLTPCPGVVPSGTGAGDDARGCTTGHWQSRSSVFGNLGRC